MRTESAPVSDVPESASVIGICFSGLRGDPAVARAATSAGAKASAPTSPTSAVLPRPRVGVEYLADRRWPSRGKCGEPDRLRGTRGTAPGARPRRSQGQLTRPRGLTGDSTRPWQLRGIGGNCQAILLEDHKLMASARVWTVESQLPQPSDELPPTTRRPPAHGPAPCSDRSRRSPAKNGRV